MRKLLNLSAALLAAISISGLAQAQSDRGDGYDALETKDVNWKMVLMTGDDSINAFDNARKKLQGMFQSYGIEGDNFIQLSRMRSQQVKGVRATTLANFEGAMMDLNVGPDDGCAVFMTSHGSRSGFYLKGDRTLTPTKLDSILDAACGERPTVVLISACYSGVFMDALKADNRIIMTAARKDRTSFGCSAEATYTYWDACMITELPEANSWQELYTTVTACIEVKESRGNFKRSYPQASFGSILRDARIFKK